jgi:Glycosyltransferase like family
MSMYEIASVICGGKGPKLPRRLPITRIDNRKNLLTPCQAYQQALEQSKAGTIIYIHDDVEIFEDDWMPRIINEFDLHPNAAAIGLGGAASLGHPNLYKVPYQLPLMARGDYRSNQTDAEVHGTIERKRSRVAVLDAFFMAVRRDFLLSVGGWPVQHLTHHCLDLWLACEAARHGKETWQVGVSCCHFGGRSSTKGLYQNAKWLQGGSSDLDHSAPHRWLYESYRDILPIRID